MYVFPIHQHYLIPRLSVRHLNSLVFTKQGDCLGAGHGVEFTVALRHSVIAQRKDISSIISDDC